MLGVLPKVKDYVLRCHGQSGSPGTFRDHKAIWWLHVRPVGDYLLTPYSRPAPLVKLSELATGSFKNGLRAATINVRGCGQNHKSLARAKCSNLGAKLIGLIPVP